MKKVIAHVWSSDEGKYLFYGSCFENELLKQFEHDSEYSGKKKWYKLLKQELTKCKESHPQDKFHEIFDKHIYINYEFAEKLNRLDILDAQCLLNKTELGKAMIELCGGLWFIVYQKYWGEEAIEIHFEVCHMDYITDCFHALIKCEIP